MCQTERIAHRNTVSVSTVFILMSLLLFLISTTTRAEENLLLILDGSGSMWGRVNGQPKIVIAKDVVGKIVAESSGELSMGLMVYGHRRKGDCSDLEMRVPVGGVKSQVAGSFLSVMPKGKTPLAASLEMAAAQLNSKENKTTIVLVSDGLETCKGDPCTVAAQLKQQGHKLIIHTVGFDVNNKAAEQLACIAQAGGGQYFTADDSSSLEEALKSVETSVATAEPVKVEVTEKPQVAQIETSSTTGSKKIKLAGPATVILQPASWVSLPKYWKLVEAESGEERGRSTEQQMRIRPGEYQIVWRQAEHGYGDVPLTAVVNAVSGKKTTVAIDTGIELYVPDAIKKPRWWGLGEVGTAKPLFQFGKGLGPHVVPAGDYELLWRQTEHDNNTALLGKVEIRAGSLNQIVADSGVDVQVGSWVDTPSPYAIQLVDSQDRVVAHGRKYGPQLAPSGAYRLIFRLTEHDHNDIEWGEVTITEHSFTAVKLDSGIIFTHQKGARPPYRVIFVNLDTGKEVVSQNSWKSLPLPPGRYQIDWWESQHNSSRQTLVEEFDLETGVAAELEL